VLKADGTYAGGIIILNDLTDLQQTSIELAKKSSELKVANDAKERMLSLLAHDLKEGVVSSLEITRLLAKGEFSNAEEKECLSLLEDSLSKTSNLLLKTLEWVKEQSDLSKNRRLSVVLSKLVKDVERSLRDKIEAKNLEVVFDLDANLKVDIDPVLIRSVLRNIIVNAIKFSDKRGSNIHIYSEIEDQDYLVLHIKDQGMGMSKKELNKLTHLDYQDSKQGSAGEKGSGMGLKLVQELLLAHGSPLQVQSVLNQGSDFYFRLPISGN
jgi:signal transduction histidine kinase